MSNIKLEMQVEKDENKLIKANQISLIGIERVLQVSK